LYKDIFKILIEEYSHTDGNKNGNNILIYTSKIIEKDIIQTAAITNGYMCSYLKRIGHGFSKVPNYQISINMNTNKNYRRIANTEKAIKIEKVKNEPFWCLSVKNKTLIIRRNGKVCVVGNCHNTLKEKGRSIDVGVDRWNFKPIGWNEIYDTLKDRDNKELYE
jgi:hypothetical protein